MFLIRMVGSELCGSCTRSIRGTDGRTSLSSGAITGAEDRVYFRDEAAEVASVPTMWTDAGRSPFRTEDLLALADLIKHLDGRVGSVQEMTP